MSRENVETVRAMFEPYARGDFTGFADLPDDFEFVASPELPDAGSFRGGAATGWMTAWVESFEGLVEGRRWMVITVPRGEVVRAAAFPERAQALEAAGLSE